MLQLRSRSQLQAPTRSALNFMPQSAQPFPEHPLPRYRDSVRCFPVWNGPATTELHANSWCDDKPTRLLSVALSVCRRQPDPIRFPRPSCRQCARTGGFQGAATCSPGSGTRSPRHAGERSSSHRRGLAHGDLRPGGLRAAAGRRPAGLRGRPLYSGARAVSAFTSAPSRRCSPRHRSWCACPRPTTTACPAPHTGSCFR